MAIGQCIFKTGRCVAAMWKLFRFCLFFTTVCPWWPFRTSRCGSCQKAFVLCSWFNSTLESHLLGRVQLKLISVKIVVKVFWMASRWFMQSTKYLFSSDPAWRQMDSGLADSECIYCLYCKCTRIHFPFFSCAFFQWFVAWAGCVLHSS